LRTLPPPPVILLAVNIFFSFACTYFWCTFELRGEEESFSSRFSRFSDTLNDARRKKEKKRIRMGFFTHIKHTHLETTRTAREREN